MVLKLFFIRKKNNMQINPPKIEMPNELNSNNTGLRVFSSWTTTWGMERKRIDGIYAK